MERNTIITHDDAFDWLSFEEAVWFEKNQIDENDTEGKLLIAIGTALLLLSLIKNNLFNQELLELYQQGHIYKWEITSFLFLDHSHAVIEQLTTADEEIVALSHHRAYAFLSNLLHLLDPSKKHQINTTVLYEVLLLVIEERVAEAVSLSSLARQIEP